MSVKNQPALFVFVVLSFASLSFANIIIGVNDLSGWGPDAANILKAHGFHYDRIDFDVMTMQPNIDPKTVFGYGFQVLGILNVDDNTDLGKLNIATYVRNAVQIIRMYPQITLWEILNESYLKANKPNPRAYGRLAMALYDAVDRAKIKGRKLLLNSEGDYPLNSQKWSSVDSTPMGGWVADMLRAAPRLKQRAQGFTSHPYGRPEENSANNAGGKALLKQHAAAVKLGFHDTSFYITEVGYSIGTHSEGASAKDENDQATLLTAMYNKLLSLKDVKGIWWYQSHDDGTGNWGLMDSNTNRLRPSFYALAAIASKHNIGIAHLATDNSTTATSANLNTNNGDSNSDSNAPLIVVVFLFATVVIVIALLVAIAVVILRAN